MLIQTHLGWGFHFIIIIIIIKNGYYWFIRYVISQ